MYRGRRISANSGPHYSYRRSRARAYVRDRAFCGPSENHIYNDTDEDEDCTSEVSVPELEAKLHVTRLDLHVLTNAKAHHTDRYECTVDRIRESDGSQQKARPVIRRGQDFTMTIHFDRPYDIQKNDITLTFYLGKSYKPRSTTTATIKVDESGNTNFNVKYWGASVVGQDECTLTLSVFVPATVPIGEWEFSVKTTVDVKNGKSLTWQYNHNEEISILFNPWCKEDWVYLDHEDWLKEAVLNDSGVLYYGDVNRIGARPWTYGQFEDGILEASFHLLRKGCGYEATPIMGDTVRVSRILTKLVNAPDDGGVLMGNWTGEYDDGTCPTSWTGSVKILREYMSSAAAVKYGQCWVFAGVLTTVARALGMPCRNVTCFSSAHNADTNLLSMDVINAKNASGEWVNISEDSVWNFHVWNEVWMKRPDLSELGEYDGWQVVDATPQERSYDGVYVVGPCPVKAVKEGDIHIGCDGGFIFSEMNSDRVELTLCESTGMLLETKRTPNQIGLAISTHIPSGRAFRGVSMCSLYAEDNLERLDVTDEYKYKEGTNACSHQGTTYMLSFRPRSFELREVFSRQTGTSKEREIVRKAEMMFRKCSSYVNGCIDEHEVADREMITIEIEQNEEIFVGEGFEFAVNLKNTGNSARLIKQLLISVYYKTYFDTVTGVAGVKRFEDVNVDGQEVVSYQIAVDEERASKRPQDGFHFEIKAVAEFYDTENIVTSRLNFRLRRPDIQITGPPSSSLFKEVQLQVTFVNPLNVTLTNCRVDLEGGFKFIKPSQDKLTIPNIEPGVVWQETLTVEPKGHPRDKDERDLKIAFHSRQLSDIYGYYTMDITWGGVFY